jgi:hypothetical protein
VGANLKRGERAQHLPDTSRRSVLSLVPASGGQNKRELQRVAGTSRVGVEHLYGVK